MEHLDCEAAVLSVGPVNGCLYLNSFLVFSVAVQSMTKQSTELN